MTNLIGNAHKLITFLLEQDQETLFELKRYKPRRSLTQNAYYWVLNEKLASVLHMGRQELHERLLKEYAPCDVVSVLADVPLGDYFTYYDVFAESELNGKLFKHVRIYKRSSRMNSAEFSRLVDGLVDECHQQGIETKSKEEIARLEYIAPKGE